MLMQSHAVCVTQYRFVCNVCYLSWCVHVGRKLLKKPRQIAPLSAIYEIHLGQQHYADIDPTRVQSITNLTQFNFLFKMKGRCDTFPTWLQSKSVQIGVKPTHHPPKRFDLANHQSVMTPSKANCQEVWKMSESKSDSA